ncbi:GSCOCG00002230001-RA-CDS [Cotesia congregata]|nr:GSCOCG00002230001-RA-CDS [Cotesia congregata]
MDRKYLSQRSLPPLVEGKVHGYLDLTIDKIVWTRRSPGSVTVVACWWGELDNAKFNPSETTKDTRDNTETYSIKTNFELFKEYLKNAESLSLSVLSKKTQQSIGTASVTNLLEIFSGKLVTSVSIYSPTGLKLGEINICLQLSRPQKNKPRKREKMPEIEKISSVRSIYFSEINSDLDSPRLTSDNYRSILREKRTNLENKKNPLDLTDRLVAQVVARARKLRGALSNDSSDPLALSDSTIDSYRSDESAEKEAALYKYLMGSSMSRRKEKKALETLRTQSPTPSLIDFAVETIRSCNENHPPQSTDLDNNNQYLTSIPKEESSESTTANRWSVQRKEASPIDYVDSVRIVVDSLKLTPAGFRRVKSSCLSKSDFPVSVTYFVQYDPSFLTIKKVNKKTSCENKPVKMCSKQQEEENVYFNHEAVYNLPKSYLRMEVPLRFKVFNRHLNQRTPAELGICSMYISDAARSSTLGTTQRLAVVKKGIKIGELKVSVELGCDKTHFGKQFVEAVTSTKENIPVLELSPNFASSRYKTATGDSKSSRATSAPEKKESLSWGGNNNCNYNNIDRNIEKKRSVEVEDVPRFSTENTLLHGLIYISDGRDLPDVSTYLICRTFWREDRSVSKVCTGRNPYYNFYQLVPLIHNLELLERTKDNCIITEVYSKNATDDSLIGIAKLPVHQLYVAYRDPLVLQHLLRAKYPVISVDGWVAVTDPVSGRHCGEIYALVALGTAEQIALLEMTRGIRTHTNLPSVSAPAAGVAADNRQRNESPAVKTQECQTEITVDAKHTQEDQNNRDEAVIHTIVDRLAQALSAPKTIVDQGAQTEFKFQNEPPRDKERQKIIHVEPLCLDNLNNSQSFSAESSTDSPQDNFNMSREIFRSVGVGAEFDEPPDQTRSSNTCDHPSDSDDNVAGTSFHLADNPSRDYLAADVDSCHSDKDVSNEKAFKVMVEIDCALHLPKVEVNNEILEPCTYVTFQKFRTNDTNRIDAYMITNVCPYSSSPKYEWRCETKLPTDLLIKEEKRLVMKVWRLLAPDVSMSINLEKDILVGISAIDLSVLTSGFPTISGWYHIMDFGGKSNGQLKISITPLENVVGLGKSVTTRPVSAFNYTNLSSPYSDDLAKQDHEGQEQDSEEEEDQNPAGDIELKINSNLSFGGIPTSILSQSLNDKMDQIKESLRFRLNEVTSKAFEDLAQQFDPTEQDFEFEDNENDKENDLDNINVPWLSQPPAVSNSVDHPRDISERTINGNGTEARPSGTTSTVDTGYSSVSNTRSAASLTNGHYNPTKNRLLQSSTNTNINGSSNGINGKDSRVNAEHSPYRVENPCVRNNKTACSNPGVFNLDLNNSSVPLTNNQYRDRDTNQPVRGTRMHINHLLDKLSPQSPIVPPAIGNSPMKRSIMDLLSSLRHNNNNNNNNLSNNVKCNREVNLRTVPTQTENYTSNSRLFNLDSSKWLYHGREIGRDDAEIPAKTQKREKISTVIREELIADDQNNDTVEYDFLSAQLMTSNVRHMGSLNPLFYPHLIPDVPISDGQSAGANNDRQENNSTSLNSGEADEAVERLDNRYVESFNATINKSLKRLRDQDVNSSHKSTSTSEIDHMSTVALGDSADVGYFGAIETGEVSRVTPSGVSENVDGNIDVTVIHKPCNDDLMACNSVGSTITTTGAMVITPSTMTTVAITTTSTSTNTTSQLLYDNDMQTVSEINDNTSLNSSETSVSVISRQAPDGGNPIEDPGRFVSKPNNHEHDDSSSES